jgi:hypothetical protein
MLQSTGFDPATEVLLAGPSRPLHPSPDQDTVGPDLIVKRTGPDCVSVEVSMVDSGYLVLNDTYYPGWRATVDGERAPILTANHAFRAVYLEPGYHDVVFMYMPLSFRIGAGISAGALLFLFVSLVVVWLQRTGGRR